eukprot:TRINITY_DN5739_c0_g1_i16.p1 TRINITY_DN5739_c0_g1~~TRINITY_DN5739_c0_g1_i16.p1  ORF type:complete len:112 (+),score=39.48 TRINITY_DN5739_c0_g1_i16:123-458(+)
MLDNMKSDNFNAHPEENINDESRKENLNSSLVNKIITTTERIQAKLTEEQNDQLADKQVLREQMHGEMEEQQNVKLMTNTEARFLAPIFNNQAYVRPNTAAVSKGGMEMEA